MSIILAPSRRGKQRPYLVVASDISETGQVPEISNVHLNRHFQSPHLTLTSLKAINRSRDRKTVGKLLSLFSTSNCPVRT